MRYQFSAMPDVLASTIDLIESFQTLTRRHQCRLTVVIVQPRDAVEGGLVQSWSQSRHVAELLVAACRARGIDVLDMVDHMSGGEDRKTLFYPRDGHFTARGQQRVAEALWRDVVLPAMATVSAAP